MPHDEQFHPSNPQERRIWFISICAASLSFILGVAAFFLSAERPIDFVDALYSSAHLLALHMRQEDLPRDPHSASSLALLYVARFFAVVAWASTAVALTFLALGRRIELLRTVYSRDHAVICGLGVVGRKIATQLIAAKQRVLVIDRGEDLLATREVIQAGASIIHGNPSDPRLLERARASSARLVFAASDDDTVNLSTGLELTRILKTKPPNSAGNPLHLYVHVAEPQLRLELQNPGWLADSIPYIQGGAFSIYDSGARLLLRDHPLDHSRIPVNDRRCVQLVLAGFGMMGEAILVRAILIGHYANLKRSRAIVFDTQAQRAYAHFQSRYPNFTKVADVEFRESDPQLPETQDKIAGICGDRSETVSTVIIPLQERVPAFALAISLARKLPSFVPVRFRLDEEDLGIGSALGNHSRSGNGASVLTPFNPINAACQAENWANRELDVTAMAFHEDYVSRLSETEKTRLSAAPWAVLRERFRESNRQAADHIPVKLRAIGCRSVPSNSDHPGVPVKEFRDEEVEILARMEHRRWIAERFMGGWQLGPKDEDNRLSPYLVEWELIPPDIQELDRNSARLIPALLARIGMEVRR